MNYLLDGQVHKIEEKKATHKANKAANLAYNNRKPIRSNRYFASTTNEVPQGITIWYAKIL